MVVVKYEVNSPRGSAYIGGGVSSTNVDERKYQFHLRAGVEKNLIRYVGENSELIASTGIQSEDMYSHTSQKGETVPRRDISGQLDLVNKLSGKRDFSSDLRACAGLEVRHTLGVKDVGEFTGNLSTPGTSSVANSLSNMRFHFNQMNANLEVQKDLGRQITSVTTAQYQGSNIGQKVRFVEGIDIKVPSGTQIFAFTGYTKNFKGYLTQNPLLVTSKGPEFGIIVEKENKTQIYGRLKKDQNSKPVFETGIKIPTGGKR